MRHLKHLTERCYANEVVVLHWKERLFGEKSFIGSTRKRKDGEDFIKQRWVWIEPLET